ncbi:inositol-pentakisphosphate 2-kinase [Lipomyces oligophaga]|uniref:inositol-pentakisphosphate 2-kinase n=1 Tax=Lipomyces oligophaga TaxID=45792 RepID=UPI0034CF0FF2
MDRSNFVSAPIASASELKYIAEGAANVLYSFSNKGFLLRLRKEVDGQATTVAIFDFLNMRILPQFNKQRDLVALTRKIAIERDVLLDLNLELLKMDRDQTRVRKRMGEILSVDQSDGLLVEDLRVEAEIMHNYNQVVDKQSFLKTAVKGSSSSFSYLHQEFQNGDIYEKAVIEFKPKWLSQSKDATSGWISCRTCALRRLRAHQRGLDRNGFEFCPLDLVSSDLERIKRSVAILVPEKVDVDMKALHVEISMDKGTIREALAKFVYGTEVFNTLAQVQNSNDCRGILGGYRDGEFDWEYILSCYSVAMTVRDCTAFISFAWEDRYGVKSDQAAETAEKHVHANGDYVEDKPGEGRAVVIDANGVKRVMIIRCRLADFDMKNAESKLAYWRAIEKELAGDGWYSGRDADGHNCT